MSHLRIGVESCTIRVWVCVDYGMDIEYILWEIYIDRINNIYEGVLKISPYGGEIEIAISEPMIKVMTRGVENLSALDNKWFKPETYAEINTGLYNFWCTVSFNKLNVILMEVKEYDFYSLKEAFEFVDQFNEHFDDKIWQLEKKHQDVADNMAMILAFKSKL